MVLALAAACTRPRPPLVLQGTIVTPDAVIERGTIVVEGGRIRRVVDRRIDVPGALTLTTEGIVFPGLVDLHNHLQWNVFPRWSPKGRYASRDAWRAAPEYAEAIARPQRLLRERHGCDMHLFGEARALVGGVTSILGASPRRCAQGRLRNIDDGQTWDVTSTEDRRGIEALLDVEALSPNAARRLAHALGEGAVPVLFVHLGEARAGHPSAREEFETLVNYGLLTDRTAIIHGTGLGDAEFEAIHESGAALVWSPRSNMELYGETTSIGMALERGIPVALAPDWALTGSSNILDELRYAAAWSREQLGEPIASRELVRMVTSVPAAIARIDDKVGAIREGLYADLLVIRGDRSDPYAALVAARPRDVQLVVIGGEPVYGEAAVLRRLRGRWDIEEVEVCGTRMALDTTADRASFLDWRYRFQSVRRRLQNAMTGARPGGTLAPIAECGS